MKIKTTVYLLMTLQKSLKYHYSTWVYPPITSKHHLIIYDACFDNIEVCFGNVKVFSMKIKTNCVNVGVIWLISKQMSIMSRCSPVNIKANFGNTKVSLTNGKPNFLNVKVSIENKIANFPNAKVFSIHSKVSSIHYNTSFRFKRALH